jgi:hypothetical protein
MNEIDVLTQIYNGLSTLYALVVTWTVIFQHCEFLLHVCAFVLCWNAGTQSLKFFLYVKNHKDLW